MLFSELQCYALIFFILKDMQSINKYNTNYFVSLYLKRYPWSSLREKYPNSVQIFSSNAEKYGPEKTPYLDTFHAMHRNDLASKYWVIKLTAYQG